MQGRVTNDGSVAQLRIDFDQTGDLIPDGFAITDSQGYFEYTPTNLNPGAVVISARASEWDQTTNQYLVGSWAVVNFSLAAVTNNPATIVDLKLQNDTGTSPVDHITTDPTLRGRIQNDGSKALVRIELDADNNEATIEATATTDSQGQFTILPKGLQTGVNNLRLRTSEWDQSTGRSIVGAWTPFSLTLEQADANQSSPAQNTVTYTVGDAVQTGAQAVATLLGSSTTGQSFDAFGLGTFKMLFGPAPAFLPKTSFGGIPNSFADNSSTNFNQNGNSGSANVTRSFTVTTGSTESTFSANNTLTVTFTADQSTTATGTTAAVHATGVYTLIITASGTIDLDGHITAGHYQVTESLADSYTASGSSTITDSSSTVTATGSSTYTENGSRHYDYSEGGDLGQSASAGTYSLVESSDVTSNVVITATAQSSETLAGSSSTTSSTVDTSEQQTLTIHDETTDNGAFDRGGQLMGTASSLLTLNLQLIDSSTGQGSYAGSTTTTTDHSDFTSSGSTSTTMKLTLQSQATYVGNETHLAASGSSIQSLDLKTESTYEEEGSGTSGQIDHSDSASLNYRLTTSSRSHSTLTSIVNFTSTSSTAVDTTSIDDRLQLSYSESGSDHSVDSSTGTSSFGYYSIAQQITTAGSYSDSTTSQQTYDPDGNLITDTILSGTMSSEDHLVSDYNSHQNATLSRHDTLRGNVSTGNIVETAYAHSSSDSSDSATITNDVSTGISYFVSSDAGGSSFQSTLAGTRTASTGSNTGSTSSTASGTSSYVSSSESTIEFTGDPISTVITGNYHSSVNSQASSTSHDTGDHVPFDDGTNSFIATFDISTTSTSQTTLHDDGTYSQDADGNLTQTGTLTIVDPSFSETSVDSVMTIQSTTLTEGSPSISGTSTVNGKDKTSLTLTQHYGVDGDGNLTGAIASQIKEHSEFRSVVDMTTLSLTTADGWTNHSTDTLHSISSYRFDSTDDRTGTLSADPTPVSSQVVATTIADSSFTDTLAGMKIKINTTLQANNASESISYSNIQTGKSNQTLHDFYSRTISTDDQGNVVVSAPTGHYTLDELSEQVGRQAQHRYIP